MDDVSRGYFIVDTKGVVDAFHIATHHMLAHGWADDGDENSNITMPGAPSSLQQADQSMEYENPITETDPNARQTILEEDRQGAARDCL